MEEHRKLRLIVPPVLFWGVILSGVYSVHVSGQTIPEWVLEFQGWMTSGDKVASIVIGLVAIGVVGLSTGFILSSMCIVIHRVIWTQLMGRTHFDFSLFTDNMFSQISSSLRNRPGLFLLYSRKRNRHINDYYASILYSHHVLGEDFKDIKEWLARRWSTYIIGINSCFSINCSILVTIITVLETHWWRSPVYVLWIASISFVSTMISLNGFYSKLENTGMHEFLLLGNAESIPTKKFMGLFVLLEANWWVVVFVAILVVSVCVEIVCSGYNLLLDVFQILNIIL